MEYRCISADCHIDLNWLPHDLFVANATPAMKDRMPYVTHGPDGLRWVTKSGLNLGFASGKGGGLVTGSRNKYIAGKEHRLEQGIAPHHRLQPQPARRQPRPVPARALGGRQRASSRRPASSFPRIQFHNIIVTPSR